MGVRLGWRFRLYDKVEELHGSPVNEEKEEDALKEEDNTAGSSAGRDLPNSREKLEELNLHGSQRAHLRILGTSRSVKNIEALTRNYSANVVFAQRVDRRLLPEKARVGSPPPPPPGYTK